MPKPYILAFIGIKGGAGKSTLATAIASEWTARGFRVVVVDLDPVQRSALAWRDLADLNGNGERAAYVYGMGEGFSRNLNVPGGADIIILDTPGGLSDVGLEALGCANLALLPCGPAAVEIKAMEKSIYQVRAVQARRRGLDAAIVIAKRRQGTVAGREIRDTLEDAAELPVLKTDLEDRQAYDWAYKAGLGPSTYDAGTEAAREMRQFTNEVQVRLRMIRKGVLRGS